MRICFFYIYIALYVFLLFSYKLFFTTFLTSSAFKIWWGQNRPFQKVMGTRPQCPTYASSLAGASADTGQIFVVAAGFLINFRHRVCVCVCVCGTKGTRHSGVCECFWFGKLCYKENEKMKTASWNWKYFIYLLVFQAHKVKQIRLVLFWKPDTTDV